MYKSIKKTNRGGKGGGGDIFSMGNSAAKQFGVDINVKTKFKDVAGLD